LEGVQDRKLAIAFPAILQANGFTVPKPIGRPVSIPIGLFRESVGQLRRDGIPGLPSHLVRLLAGHNLTNDVDPLWPGSHRLPSRFLLSVNPKIAIRLVIESLDAALTLPERDFNTAIRIEGDSTHRMPKGPDNLAHYATLQD
jgi:hypothetical protein